MYISYKNQIYYFLTSTYVCHHPSLWYSLQQGIATLMKVCRKIGSNCCILKCSLFQINSGRNVAYSQVTYEMFIGNVVGPKKWSREKILDRQNTHQKKFCSCKIPVRKNLGPTKNPREKTWDPQIFTRKHLEPTNYPREEILDPRNTHEKKLWTHKVPMRKKFGPVKYQRQKNLRPTKYPSEIILDPRNNHEKKFCTHAKPNKEKFRPYKKPTRKNFGPTK